MGAAEDIAEALAPTVRAAGLEIWDVECSGTSVRVMVEGPGGVDLDAVSSVTRAVSGVLDERDDLVPAGHYMLEVSSPGLERRLRRPDHFARYVGSRVAVKTTEPLQGARRLQGILLAAGPEAITLELDEPGGAAGRDGAASLSVPLSSVQRAHAVFEWTSPAKRTKSPAGAKETG